MFKCNTPVSVYTYHQENGTGNIPENTTTYTGTATPTIADDVVTFTYTVPSDIVLRAGATIQLTANASQLSLGTATASDVREGVTFSSNNGLNQTGTITDGDNMTF